MLDIPLRDYFRETRLFNRRVLVVVLGVAVLTVLLLARLVYLQVINYSHYATLSQENRINPVPIPPVRGLILDRHGVVLAENYSMFTLEIIPEQVDDMEALLKQLAKLVQLKDTDIRNFKKLLRRRARFESLPLRTHLSDEEAARVAIQRPFLNGVELHARLQRRYPLHGLAVHALGYVGRISEKEQQEVDKSIYRGVDHIGKLGVERGYEIPLLGKVGIKKVEINAHGRVVRTVERLPPRAGKHLHLNLDARLQAVAEQALGKQRGAVVALEPATGAVLGFASTPVYDPNAFVNGIDSESYQALLQDPDKPLINRALNGLYSPGSTIKPFLGLAGLESGKIKADDTITCPGWFRLPGDRHLFRDWKKRGHGTVDLQKGIVESCDVYFYTLARTLGIDAMERFLGSLGFGGLTGIDLPGESRGLVPSPEWKKTRGEPWYPGETVMTGIGQGPFLVTPLQLATTVAMLANGGIRMQPRLVRALEDPGTHKISEIRPQVMKKLELANPEHLQAIIEAMVQVVHGDTGTARRIRWGAKFTIAGKTGTSQVKSIAQGETYKEEETPERLRDHALFIAFAPAESPRIAVAVIVENGGQGSRAAAPIARKVMDYYLLKQEPG